MTDALPNPSLESARRNRGVATIVVSVAVAMVGAAYAAVPLYAAFCKATGYGGTTQVARAAPAARGIRLGFGWGGGHGGGGNENAPILAMAMA